MNSLRHRDRAGAGTRPSTVGECDAIVFSARRQSWVGATRHIAMLRSGQTVSFRPIGRSMKGRIESGPLCTIAPVDPATLNVGDIVRPRPSRQCLTLMHLRKLQRIRRRGNANVSSQRRGSSKDAAVSCHSTELITKTHVACEISANASSRTRSATPRRFSASASLRAVWRSNCASSRRSPSLI
jgi:hypothetical protein